MKLSISSAVLATTLAGSAWGHPFEEIISFGESLSDTGNVFISTQGIPPSPPYFNGRFANGPIWIDYLANQLGKKVASPAPSLFGGTGYAWGGAETGPGYSSVNGVPNIDTQINDGYLSDVNGVVSKPSKKLFVIWGGSDDFLGPVKPLRKLPAIFPQA